MPMFLPVCERGVCMYVSLHKRVSARVFQLWDLPQVPKEEAVRGL